jgi:hypothetical protein
MNDCPWDCSDWQTREYLVDRSFIIIVTKEFIYTKEDGQWRKEQLPYVPEGHDRILELLEGSHNR